MQKIIICLLCMIVAALMIDRYESKKPKPVTTLTFISAPAEVLKKGTILGYEDFRGYKVPIKADGHGGTYRVVTNVPWDIFTIEEKFDMARVNGGHLNEKDIEEIKQKYTKH